MGKGLKITLIILGVVLFFGFVGLIIAQKMVASKIESFLSKDLPEDVKLKYDHFDFSLIHSSFKIVNPQLTSFRKNTDSIEVTVNTNRLIIEGIGFWDLLVNDEINIENIVIDQPNIEYFYKKVQKTKTDSVNKPRSIKQNIHVKNFQTENSSFSMVNVKNDSLMLKLKNFNLELTKIEIDSTVVNETIPFRFKSYEFSFEDFFYVLNDYENIEVKNIAVSNERINYKNLRLYTKYSKIQLSQMITSERDHVDLTIEEVSFDDEEFGYHNDSIFFFKSPKVEVINPVFNIYRDKLVSDDLTIKALYSRMLRDLKFDLTLSKIAVKNGTINYSEKVKPGNTAGLISFSQLNADIKHLSNTYVAGEKTTIDIDAMFMESTPIKVNWYFDVNNENDYFIFKADMGILNAENLNQFSQPNLKIKMEGELSRTFFTIEGNALKSSIDFRMNYDDFKVIILDKEGKEKNRFLSVVANLFIKKGSKKETDEFREGSKADVERDNTKSVFNYIWSNVQAGLLSVMTGNGKK